MQYEIHIINLDPTVGSEIRKTRPCLIISPDDLNLHLRTVQVAPLTSNTKPLPWRVPLTFQGKKGMIALDQIRTVDKQRLVRKSGHLKVAAIEQVRQVIRAMLVE